jgi:hypothetical protein
MASVDSVGSIYTIILRLISAVRLGMAVGESIDFVVNTDGSIQSWSGHGVAW